MESIMTVLDTDLSDYLGEEAYNEFMGYRRAAWKRFQTQLKAKLRE
jgi:hypothetical protein